MITSTQNTKVKQWNKLKKKKGRTETGTFLVEGFHLVQEAIQSDWTVQEVILQEGVDAPSWIQGVEIHHVTDNVFQHIADTKTPQGIAAVVYHKSDAQLKGNRLLLIDAVQDPGNLGTIIRTTDAAGFGGVILGDGTVDMLNDKVVRATQGSLFHLPIIQAELTSKIKELQNDGFQVWASTLEDSVTYSELNPPTKTALIVGNEGAGITSSVAELADEKVRIPIYGKAESLNVSVATGVLLYYLATS
ncbi:RNA methyltransferase [Radiobacillus kanasensis]|uniref:TrmH family RNA methyltransferase n=1 Tax=Radiobacillus kanasensis TaxID=2844358 RepID=UPI001E493A74|nr:RNA methyltransferase [Radiobacillus kanasensis]UFT97983.1 RNA methyltransferase [Radiobacillus kanasensis]